MRRVHCYLDSNDKPHTTLAECQVAELVILLGKLYPTTSFPETLATVIVENSDEVINILNVTEKSRLGARKLNGARRKSRVKPEQASLHIEKPF